MRIFTYRNRSRFRKAALIIGICLLAAALLFVGWAIYLQRYLVYSENGVFLQLPGQDEPTASTDNTIDGTYVVGDPVSPPTLPVAGAEEKTLSTLSGVYITYNMLQQDGLLDAVTALEDGCAVMLDVKSIYGSFYYESSLEGAACPDGWDPQMVSDLIMELRRKSCYLIARLPAFRDNTFALAHQSEGLPLSNGALWMDTDGAYWLNPASELVQTRLTDICTELWGMGFREVVFDGFYFPESANIDYDGTVSRREVTTAAANALLTAFSDTPLILSFDITDCLDTYPQVTGTLRRYLEASDGGQVSSIVAANAADLTTPATQLVFLTDSRDTRFSEYGVLRPFLEEPEE